MTAADWSYLSKVDQSEGCIWLLDWKGKPVLATIDQCG